MAVQNFAMICNFWLYKPPVAQYMFAFWGPRQFGNLIG
jgi:hypothetical protein